MRPRHTLLVLLPLLVAAAWLPVAPAAAQSAAAQPSRDRALVTNRSGAERALARVRRDVRGQGRAAGSRTGRERTLLLHDLALRLPALGADDRREAQAYLARPTDGTFDPQDDGYDTDEAAPWCTQSFCVHYVTTTEDAPDLADTDGNQVPDWVQSVGAEMERARKVEVEDLQWQAPPSDGTRGGDGRTDVYVKDLCDAEDCLYGYVAVDLGFETRSAASYVVLDDDYVEEKIKGGLESLRVTAAHEYTHVLQMGIDVKAGPWLRESSATWMEEQVHPDVNDYVTSYLTGSGSWPALSLLPITTHVPEGAGNAKSYGTALLHHWLSQKYRRDGRPRREIVREAWHRAASHPASANTALEGIEDAIDVESLDGDGSLSDDFAEFAAETAEMQAIDTGFSPIASDLWGEDRNDSGYLLDHIQMSRRTDLVAGGAAVNASLNHGAFQHFDVKQRSGTLKLTATLPGSDTQEGPMSALALIGRTGDPDTGEVEVQMTKLPNGGPGTVVLSDAGRFDRITAMVVNADFGHGAWSDAKEDWLWTHDAVPVTVKLAAEAPRGGDSDAAFGGHGPIAWPRFEASNGTVEIPQIGWLAGAVPDANGNVIVGGSQTDHVWPGRSRAKMLRLNGGWAHSPVWGTGTDWGVETQKGGTFFQSQECHEGIQAMSPDGQGGYIGAGGSGCMSNTAQGYIVRATATGAYNTAWGADGQRRYPPEIASSFSDAKVQSDGKIVAAGWKWTGGCGSCGHLRVTRLKADGSIDDTFNGSGVFLHGGVNTAGAVAIQPDDKIVVGIADAFYTGGPIGVLRLNADGTLDTGFGDGGLMYAPPGFDGRPYGTRDVAIAPDGSITVAGGQVVARFTADGQRDETFGYRGAVTTALADSACAIQIGALELQPDGKAVIGGAAVNGFDGAECEAPGFSLARLRTDGSLDPSFGFHGRVLGTPRGGAGTSSSGIARMATMPSGALYAIGAYSRRAGHSEEPAAYRYLTGPSGPKNLLRPTISGTGADGGATDGDVLTANLGSWTGTTGTTTSYEWLRCPKDDAGSCAVIEGATASTYKLVPADTDHRIQVRVTRASSLIGNAALSRATARIRARPVVMVQAPAVAGHRSRSQPLTASSSWSGTDPKVEYRWLRCYADDGTNCLELPATDRVYEPIAADQNRRLRVQVTASNADSSVTETSPPTSPIGAAERFAARPRWSAAPEFRYDPLTNPSPDAFGTAGTWQYMSGPNAALPNPADFKLLTNTCCGYWGNDEPHMLVKTHPGEQRMWLHPSASSAAVAWKAPESGLYRVSGALADHHPDVLHGDGVEYALMKGATRLLGGDLPAGAQERSFASGQVALLKGQLLYFAVRPKADHSWDGAIAQLVVEAVRPSVTIDSPVAGQQVSPKPTLSGRASSVAGDATSVTVKIYAGTSGTGTPVRTISGSRVETSWAATVGTALPAGTYAAVAQQTGPGGAVGTSATRTFKVVPPPNALVSAGKLRWTADEGTLNTVTIARSGDAITVADALAAVRPGPGCTVVTTKKVSCPATSITGIQASAGDLDDTVTVTGATPATLTGGDGDDTLTGGTGDDSLDGGAGGDVLKGGGGTDTVTYAARTETVMVDVDGVRDDGSAVDGTELSSRDDVELDVENLVGGSAADTLTGSPSANLLDGGKGGDTLAGGGGTDTVTYAGHTAPLTVKLDGYRNDGGTEDSATVAYRDNVKADVENLIGGSGDDTLTGSAAANVIDGGPGGDRISGGGGTDTASYASRAGVVKVSIDGERGDGGVLDGSDATVRDDVELDVENLVGGAGADTLLGSPSANVLDGGRGGDILGGGDGVDTVTYASRTTGVTADIDGVRDDGSAEDSATVGLRDSVRTDVENLTGGSGDDTLTAALATTIVNVLSGGLGNDTLKTRDGTAAADRIFCGGDTDAYDRDGTDAYSSCETAVTLP